MKLSQLINELMNLASDLNPDLDDGTILRGDLDVDPEVRLATQQRYPLAFHLDCVTHLTPDAEPQSEAEEEGWEDHRADPTPEQPGIVWLAEGGSCYDSPYAPRAAWGE